MEHKYTNAVVDVICKGKAPGRVARANGLDEKQLERNVGFVLQVIGRMPVRAPAAGILEVGGVRFGVRV